MPSFWRKSARTILPDSLVDRLRPGRVLEPSFVATAQVELEYWRSPKGVNFGDYLSSVVVQRMLARREIVRDEEQSASKRMLAVGSILHFARTGDTVWGSGVNGKIAEAAHTFETLDVRAVRGPLTRAFLQERGIAVPKVYGDPALLLPRLFEQRFRRPQVAQTGTVILPNLHDLPLVAGEAGVVSPLLPWWQVIERIIEASDVIASSLHGLVIADAFGVPARMVRLSETEPMFKYDDYALGAGRARFEPAGSLDEAREMRPVPPPRIDTSALEAAFPYDLWTIA